VVVGNSIIGCTARIANNGTNNVIIDTFAGNVGIGAIVAPIGDNVFTMGTSSNRWSSVFAANGTIQTSDPNEKTDIVPISGPTALALVDKIQPITFRWKVGGHDPARNADGKQTYEARPGKRTHWGFDAAAIKQAFDATGMDFGGYVLSEDGKHSLRPDQLIPVLWQALKQISVQVDKLTADVSAMKPAEGK